MSVQFSNKVLHKLEEHVRFRILDGLANLDHEEFKVEADELLNMGLGKHVCQNIVGSEADDLVHCLLTINLSDPLKQPANDRLPGALRLLSIIHHFGIE